MTLFFLQVRAKHYDLRDFSTSFNHAFLCDFRISGKHLNIDAKIGIFYSF